MPTSATRPLLRRAGRATGLVAAVAALAVGFAGPASAATAVVSGSQTVSVKNTAGGTDWNVTMPTTVTGDPGDTATVTVTFQVGNPGSTGIAFGGPGLTLAQAQAAASAALPSLTCVADPSVTGQYGNQSYYVCTLPSPTTIPNFRTLTVSFPVTIPASPNTPGATVSDFSAGVVDPNTTANTSGEPLLTGSVVDAVNAGAPVANPLVAGVAGLLLAAFGVMALRRRRSAVAPLAS